jgi:serine O-acetyltransferase
MARRPASRRPNAAPAAQSGRPAGARAATRYNALAARVLSAASGLEKGLAAEGPLPSRRDILVLVEELLEVLFPESHRMGSDRHSGATLVDHVADTIASLEIHLDRAIHLGMHRLCSTRKRPKNDKCDLRAESLTERLLAALPDIRAKLGKDVLAAYDSDPAATGIDEIVACYPGLYAIAIYRVAHHLLGLGAEVLPRMLTEHAHSRTGIDIHPGATIGESFFIDHGTGIVIGETSVIGNRVRIYQGVTLGALSIKDRGRSDLPPTASKASDAAATKKRHPTIEDDAIIYANATILGGKTVIGQGAVVGGNAWITYSVPPRTRVGVGT